MGNSSSGGSTPLTACMETVGSVIFLPLKSNHSLVGPQDAMEDLSEALCNASVADALEFIPIVYQQFDFDQVVQTV